MISLLHRESSPFSGGYSSSEVSGWAPGEVREVPAELAAYLLETFPEVFAAVQQEPDPVASPPPARRARKG